MFDYLRNKLRFVTLEVGPNFQIDDGFVALYQLLFGRLINVDSARIKVKNWFKSYTGQDNNATFDVYFTTNARHSLYLLLKSLELPEHSEVLLQGFSCIVVPNAVLQANLKPITCDISSSDFNCKLDSIESLITPQTRVWIIQHNFGLVIDIQKVKEIAEKYNLIIIEDCAHSLGATYNGKHVGSFGHAAIFSFGRDKIVSTTNGGAVTFNSSETAWQNRFAQEYEKLTFASAKQTRENLLYPILVVFFIRPFYQLLIGKIVAVLNLRFRLTGEIYTLDEKNTREFATPTQYSPQLYPLLIHQLNKCETYNDHRRKLAKIYSNSFSLPFNPEHVYLRFPLYLKQITKSDNIGFNSSRYTQILSKTKRLGIYLGNWYTQTFVGSAFSEDKNPYNYTPETVPTITKLIQHQVINLPTNINTSVDEAELICQLVNNVR
jgi:dTDP-4-amino-4,6-dideoxygalactose transaminase